MTKTLLVTGTAGQLGRRVVELLREHGAGMVVAGTRHPAQLAKLEGVDVRRSDFDDIASLDHAFAGVQRALLISTDALGRRVEQHTRAIEAMVNAGVEHVVYTSLPNAPSSSVSIAPDHAATEAALRASGMGYTILRNNLYMDLLLHTLPKALREGQLIDARGEGETAFVTREDCARAAAAALMTESSNRILDVTGPEALTSGEVAGIASELTGKPLKHVAVSPRDLEQGLLAHGVPPAMTPLFVTFDMAIARGELAQVSATVHQLTGRAPATLRDYLRSVRTALV